MGQTLTHGVYLPDEGERNCYSGLAANWQILDNSVGTIASHTTQIAGKAPAVHTHTKSDITDFPAYGTTAGTICEGNDSRLSDARTPVAHTHTKSNVTDLLNSNFIPNATNSYDLGSASKQWNNLYAKKVNTQSVNGVNPGALSLPDMSATGVDISGSIVPPSGETTINISGGVNTYTATTNGWLCISKKSSACRYIKTVINNSTLGQTTIVSGSVPGTIYHCQPVPAGKTVSILLDADSQARYYFYPCLGNV